MKLMIAAAAAVLAFVPAASAAEKRQLSKDEAREASIGHVYSSGSCRTRDTGTCDGVTAPECTRMSSSTVRCLARWGGDYTDPFTGAKTGTWSCEQLLTWKSTRRQPKLAQATGAACT